MAEINPRNSVNWLVNEGVNQGYWTRDGNGNSDVQRFINFEGDTLQVHYVGNNRVYVERYKASDLHFYHGVISEDGRTIQGKYLSAQFRGELLWSAKINR